MLYFTQIYNSKYKDYSYIRDSIFNCIIQYIYVYYFLIKNDFFFTDLLVLADSYLETNLKNKCVQIFKRKITSETAILLYDTAVKYNVEACTTDFNNAISATSGINVYVCLSTTFTLQKLQELCLNFIVNNS